ncbi:MAG: hypothetical protein HY391_05195 [Deltaproteobacteria bacterium]|nr:hypothetical protein [Deltaproteobacteria bacterium]
MNKLTLVFFSLTIALVVSGGSLQNAQAIEDCTFTVLDNPKACDFFENQNLFIFEKQLTHISDEDGDGIGETCHYVCVPSAEPQ